MDDIKQRIAALESALGISEGADESGLRHRVDMLEKRFQSIIDSDDTIKAVIEEVENLQAAGLLPADSYIYEVNTAAASFIEKNKLTKEERAADILELTDGAERVDKYVGQLQQVQELSADALDSDRLRGIQKHKDTVAKLVQTFQQHAQNAASLHHDTENALKTYSNLVDYITAETIVMDRALPASR